MSDQLSLQSTEPGSYLQSCEIVDFDHPAVQAQADMLRLPGDDAFGIARQCFEFVRDEIAHSWDAQRGPVTLKASEVMLAGGG